MSPDDDDPSARVAAAYAALGRGAMAGLPLNNPALRVETVGFRRWQGVWVGVLVTPWTLSLILLPAGNPAFRALDGDQVQDWHLPSGVYEFRGGRLAGLGPYQTCSLFSPPAEFADQDAARAVAEEVMAALLRPLAEAVPAAHSRRDFLRASFRNSA
ncbi:[NiFe]-hydrogenase assembly chaperone HybE [Methylococcus sp. EFPC2]|uniref:[NiFe]-hydrogenase assembly chaperone HybE n=1 Tax=Methylococcus sp. EFPC2 TaxID=2812648 RepID=UPI001966F8D4|nr:[NiFe]-hydrogenase assembly chaperone HybE [Methylococcus sp. EFPC2]QSA97325.1 [NiFe]-hydrogenase assembly chaperone HybE [Methylococcus sp. EFPC2]